MNLDHAASDQSAAPDLTPIIEQARAAQEAWQRRTVGARLRCIRRLRHAIAGDAMGLAASLERAGRHVQESLAAEILPLADACRFLERSAERLLAPRRLGSRGRPGWMFGYRAEVRREPAGIVLIIGPDNYPLLLPGVQLVQALVAGNAVLVKPAPGCSAPIRRLLGLIEGDLPPGLCTVLGETTEAARAALDGPIDHVVLTGSAATGARVLEQLARSLTPSTMELSGADAVFVLPGADPAMVADALAFGLRFNGGATCIAPRRVFVTGDARPALEAALVPRLEALPAVAVRAAVRDRLRAALGEAQEGGARLRPSAPDLARGAIAPFAVFDADPRWQLLRADLFAPFLSVVEVPDLETALAADQACPYALGASIFGPERDARALAERIDAGSVSINDLIVPSADPRLPFGGRGRSGFGVTRGAEGLLAMTVVKTVSVRSGRFRPHYAAPSADQDAAALAWLDLAHGTGWHRRGRAFGRLLRALGRIARDQK